MKFTVFMNNHDQTTKIAIVLLVLGNTLKIVDIHGKKTIVSIITHDRS